VTVSSGLGPDSYFAGEDFVIVQVFQHRKQHNNL
jgi:hypothetical protein